MGFAECGLLPIVEMPYAKYLDCGYVGMASREGCVCLCLCVYLCVYVNVHVYVCVCDRVYMCVDLNVYICGCAYVHVCCLCVPVSTVSFLYLSRCPDHG